MSDRSVTEQLANWLGLRAPWAHRAARTPWRLARRALGGSGYWERRRGMAYYEAVVRIAREQVPGSGAVLDVGSHETELVDRLDWFDRRLALDLRYVPPRPGVELIVADFMDYEPGEVFDLVLCLQVLEHLPDPEPFARKLLATGRTVIVSVPYRWPPDAASSHRHDPVDEERLRSWMGREPMRSELINDGPARLISVYPGAA